MLPVARQVVRLTRYMSFPRFVSCLKDGLFIPSPVLFDDRWEGLMPFGKLPFADLTLRSQEYQQIAPWMYVSCWHQRLHESFPMWKIYGQAQEAVSITTTDEKLESVVGAQYSNVVAYLSRVQYVNPARANLLSLPPIHLLSSSSDAVIFKKARVSMLYMYMKHDTYDYEEEVRLVMLDPNYLQAEQEPKKGIHLNISSIADFIEHVTVAPGAPEWFFQTVKETAARFDLHCEIVRSALEFPTTRF